MSARPTLELLAAAPSPAPLVALVRDLATWCEPIAGAPWSRPQPPAARLLTAPALSDAGLSGPACPTAIWHDAQGAVVIDGPDGQTTIAVPSRPLDVASLPAVMPFVRARRRVAPLVLPLRAFDGDADDVLTSLRAASAAIVPAAWLARALALATPVVTDAAAAAELGAVHDVHVVIAESTDAEAAAAALAIDGRRAARLARAGRTLVEQLDRHAVAARVADALGLLERPFPDPIARLRSRLRELDEGRP